MKEDSDRQVHSNDDDPVEFDLAEWFLFFWTNRFLFFKVLVVSGAIGVVVAFVLPKKYTAVATILPPQTSNSPSIYSQFASFPGIMSLGGSESLIRLYPDIARSRSVLSGMLDAEYGTGTFFDVLTNEYKLKRDENGDITRARETLLELLGKRMNATADIKTNLVTIKITERSPELAAAIVNEILKQMDDFLRYRLKTVATNQSRMIENRLVVVADSLRVAEEKLLRFRESNRTTSLSPKLQIYDMRLLREVEVNNAVYVELSKQLEIAKIQEVQLRPVLNVLDRATSPIRKSWPSRRKVVLLFLVLGFSTSIGCIRLRKYILDSGLKKS